MISLHCCIHRIAFDHEGEATITLKIPLVDRDNVLKLAEHTEQVLFLNVDPEGGTDGRTSGD